MHSDFFLAFVTLFFAATGAFAIWLLLVAWPVHYDVTRLLSDVRIDASGITQSPPPMHPDAYRAIIERDHRHAYVYLGMGSNWAPRTVQNWRRTALAVVEARVERQRRVYEAWAAPAQIVPTFGRRG
jgi:hypothetical protein